MQLKYAQIIGLNTDQKASQTNFTSQDEENAFLAVLQLSCDDAFTKGRQTLAELSDFYFEFDGSPAQKLTATFGEAAKKFSEAEFHLGLATVSGKVLYLISQGEVVALLKREDKISNLLEMGSEKQLISGFLNEGDRILLATKSLTQTLADDLAKLLKLSLEEFEEELSDRVGMLESESGGMAALLVESEASSQPEIADLSKQAESAEESDQAHDMAEIGLEPAHSPPKFMKVTFILSAILKKFPKSGRGRLVLALLLMIIIGAGIGLKYINDKNKVRETQFNSLIADAQNDFNAAKGLQSLNFSEAKLKLESAKDKVNQALNLKRSDKKAQDLKKQIESETAAILQQFQAQSFPEFLDLNLIKKDFKAQNLTLSNGKILLLDPSTKTLVTLDLAKKSNQILSGEDQLGAGQYAALSDNMAYVFSKDKGVLKIDTTNLKVTTVSKTDDEWGKIVSLMPFASNVYLLDSGKNKIWKYVPSSSGYSDKREYLSLDVKAELSDGLVMQIDSAIYVLKQNGQILKFLRGAKDNFSYQGLDKDVKNPKSFFVSDESENLYLLDSGNSRLLILTKTGSYKAQIEGEKFGIASDLVVDEKGKKVYLLEGPKIYQVDLK